MPIGYRDDGRRGTQNDAIKSDGCCVTYCRERPHNSRTLRIARRMDHTWAHVHGGFGTFIPVGIRIGLDALQRLNAKAREVTVVYYDSDKAPCACLADGVAIATVASVGQRTLQIAPEKATVGAMAIIIIRRKQSGEAVKYRVADSWLPKLAEWNQTLDPRGRYDAVMKAGRPI